MSLFPPFHRGVRRTQSWTGFARPTTSTGTLITANSSIHTLSSSFTEIIAATAHDAHWVTVYVQDTTTSNTQTDGLLNIYIGAGGAEQVLIPNLLVGWANAPGSNVGPGRTYEFPLFIPAGSRLSAKSQALISSDTVRVTIELYGGGEPGNYAGRRVECIGASTAASQGTSVTPGSASDGSFTDIGTTANEWRYILPMIQGTLTDTVMTSQIVRLDIGVGGAALAELGDWWFQTTTLEASWPYRRSRGRYCIIPAGTALQLKGQASGTAEAVDCCIYGVY